MGLVAAAWALATLWLAATATAATVPSNDVVPSNDAVTTFPQPRTLPTGGAGPLVVGPEGSVWFTQTYEEKFDPGEEPHHLPRIVRMNPLGQISLVAEHTRAEGFAVTPGGQVWFTGGFASIGRVDPDGTVDSFPLPETATEFTPAGGPIVATADGSAWFSAYRSPRAGVQGKTVAAIDRVAPDGKLTELDRPAPAAFRPAWRSDPTATSGSPNSAKTGRPDHSQRRIPRLPAAPVHPPGTSSPVPKATSGTRPAPGRPARRATPVAGAAATSRPASSAASRRRCWPSRSTVPAPLGAAVRSRSGSAASTAWRNRPAAAGCAFGRAARGGSSCVRAACGSSSRRSSPAVAPRPADCWSGCRRPEHPSKIGHEPPHGA
jgi:hypothetical protein